jgi:hypothetical protein
MGRGQPSLAAKLVASSAQSLFYSPRRGIGPRARYQDASYLRQAAMVDNNTKWPPALQCWKDDLARFVPILTRHHTDDCNGKPVNVSSYLGLKTDGSGFALLLVDRTERGRWSEQATLDQILKRLNDFWADWISGAPGGLVDRADFHQAFNRCLGE